MKTSSAIALVVAALAAVAFMLLVVLVVGFFLFTPSGRASIDSFLKGFRKGYGPTTSMTIKQAGAPPVMNMRLPQTVHLVNRL